MKKFLLFICITIFLCLPVFAKYQPIPQKYSIQYRNEINKTIKYQIPISKKNIIDVFKEIENEENIYIKNYLIEQGINSIIFEFYTELINVTNKYVNIKNDIPPTDWYGDLEKILIPYLEDNNINKSKINSFINFAKNKQIEIERKYNR